MHFLILFCVLAAFWPDMAFAGEPFKVVYLSPCPGSSFNTLQSNIIIKTNKPVDKNSFDQFSFLNVSGSKSGLHQGMLSLCDDGRTIIFSSGSGFSYDELIKVQSSSAIMSSEGGSIDSISFTFSTINKPANGKDFYKYLEIPDHAIVPESKHTTGRLSTDDLPADFPTVKITVSDNPDSDLIFIGTTSSKAPYIMILDNTGKPAYYKRTPAGTYDFKVQPNGLLTYYDTKSSCFFAMDSSYQIVDSFKCGNGYYTDIHELRILPNGHALILGFIDQVMDLSRMVDGGFTDAVVVGSVIQELDENKNVVFQWRCRDYFNVIDTYADLKQNYIDFTHGNAIDLDEDGNLLVSFRNMQEITKINRETGKIIWRLGGKKNQFKFLNDSLGFSWQHAARRLPNGNIILFDNGFKREKNYFSRAVEYKLDESLRTAELVWQFRNKPDIYSYGLGYAQRLSNGNTLIGWGTELPSITEVRPDGTKAFELSLPNNLLTYRAYRFPWKNNNYPSGRLSFSKVENKFNPVVVGDTCSFNLEIKNNNDKPIVINSVSNTTRNFYTSISFPVTVHAKSIISGRLYFKPTGFGAVKDTFRTSYDTGSESIVLSGESPFPELKANLETLDFGEVALNGRSTEMLKLTNNSINDLIISALILNQDKFICQKVNLPHLIKKGDTLALPILFKPDSLASFSDTLFIHSNSLSQISKILLKGKSKLSSLADQKDNIPFEYSLKQNFPNPFNLSTVFQYQIKEQVKVNLSIYNVLGQLIKTVVDENQTPGSYKIFWNGLNNNGIPVNSGAYIFRIQAGEFIQSKKLLMIK